MNIILGHLKGHRTILLLILMTTTVTRSITFQKAVIEKIDCIRGDVPRSRFISRILEKSLKIKEKE